MRACGGGTKTLCGATTADWILVAAAGPFQIDPAAFGLAEAPVAAAVQVAVGAEELARVVAR